MSEQLQERLARGMLLDRCPVMRFDQTPRERILDFIDDYAYNASEVCRMMNGLPPRRFRGCYFSAKEKDWWSAKGSCKKEERGCETQNSGAHRVLTSLQNGGKLKSTMLRWFDGRVSGEQLGGLPTDVFRFFYKTRRGLANRLQDDVDLYLNEKYGSLEEIQRENMEVIK